MAKTSKRTEEEMLQETFAQFQTQSSTEENPTGSDDSAPGAVKSKGGKGNIILIGGCVAAVGIIGYIFMLKPMLSAQPVPQQAPVAQVEQPKPAATPEPVQAVAPVAPVVQAPEVVVPAPALDPIAQLQAQAAQAPVVQPVAPVVTPEAPIKAPEIDNFFAQNNVPAQPAPVQAVAPVVPAHVEPQVVQPVAPVPAVAPVQPAVPVIAPAQDVVVAPVAPIVPAQPVATTALDAQQSNVVSELQNRFETQSNEFKNLLSGVDSRVGTLENKVADHDQRIIRLESFHEGQKAKVKPVAKSEGEAKNVSSGDSSKSEAKSNDGATKKVQATVKKIRPAVKPKEEAVQDENVLFGNNSGKKTAKVKEAPKKAEKPVYQEYPIHSIYGGRFWLKNGDGSLSTYAAGDKLPSGEVVKEVNDEEFTVKTNLRTIKK